MKINVTNLTPGTQEVLVTHKIGDLTTREYIKEHAVVQDVTSMLLQGFSDEAIVEVLEDDLYDTQGSRSAMLAQEIFALVIDDARAEVEQQNQAAKEWDEERKAAMEGGR